MLTLLAAGGCGGDGEGTAAQSAIDGSDGKAAQRPSLPAALAATGSTGSAAGKSIPDPLYPIVVIETSLGKIRLRLDGEKAPLTVDNFLRYVDSGHYDQTIFHQVIKDFPQLIVGGAFTADQTEKAAGTAIRNEAHNGLKNLRGTIAMARQAGAIDSATCYFYLNVTDNQEVLDHKDRTPQGYGYCVFGKVIEGMDVVEKIGDVEVQDIDQFERTPVRTVLIESARRIQ